MQESLNKEIQQSVFPYWRNHQSLKGKYSIVLSNSLNAVKRLDLDELSEHCNQSTSEEILNAKGIESEDARVVESRLHAK